MAGVVAGQPGEDAPAAAGGVAVVVGALESLAFQGCVEAFAGGIVGAGVDRAHRPGDPELVAEAGEGPGTVLRPVVGVEYGAVQAAAGRGSHPQCVGDQAGAHVVGDGPADGFAAEAIQHGREVEEL